MISNDQRKDIVICGHFALDTIIIRKTNTEFHSLGGGVTYGSLAAASYDPEALVGVVSRIGEDFDTSLFSLFEGYNIDLSGVKQEGNATTGYLLDYHDEGRDLKLLSRAPNIEIEDFPESFINAKAIHMTPIANEFSSQFIEDLANHEFTQDTLIGIDVQGIIRDFDEENNVIMRSDPEIQKQVFEMLQQFGSRMFFKASDNEARAVTGIDDLVEATEYLGQTGAYIFTTLGSGGLYFKAPGYDTIHINAYEPVQCSDETGAGDCFCAVLLLQLAQLESSQRDYDAILYAAKVASASASFKVQEKGPHGFECRDNIVDRVANGAEIIK